MEKPKRVSTRLKKESANNTAAITSTVISNECHKAVTRINGLQGKLLGLSKLGHNSSKQQEAGESPVIKDGDYMKKMTMGDSNRSKTMSLGSGLPPKTRLATKQAAIIGESSSKIRLRRRADREQKKQQASKAAVEKMKTEQQEQQMLRVLSEDLTLSDTDNDADPMVTESLNNTSQGSAVSVAYQHQGSLQPDGTEDGVHVKEGVSIPDSQSQSHHLELSSSDLVVHASGDHTNQREKVSAQKVHCARCLGYNCTVTNERRRQHLVALWLHPERETKATLVPLIVDRGDRDDQRDKRDDRKKPVAYLTKLHCDKMIKNGYRIAVKKEPESEQELSMCSVKQELIAKDSHIPHHLLSAEHPEKDRSSSPDVRNMSTSSDGDIIEEAMQAALNGDCSGECHLGDSVVHQGGASDLDKLLFSGTPLSLDHSLRNNSNYDVPTKVPEDRHETDVSIDKPTTSCISLGNMPISAHQPSPEVTSTLEEDVATMVKSAHKDVELDVVSQSCTRSHDAKVDLRHPVSRDTGSHDAAALEFGSCDTKLHAAGSPDTELHVSGSHDRSRDASSHGIGSHYKSHSTGSQDQDNFKLPQQCPVTTTTITPRTILSSSRGKRKKTPLSPKSSKKSCVVDLRLIKAAPATTNNNNKVIRTGKINLSNLKKQCINENDVSLKKIVQQKNVSLNIVKLPTNQLPAKQHWPKAVSDGFTFNLDKVVSRAAEEFSFVSTTNPTDDDNLKRNGPSVFQRLGEQQKPVTPPIEPETPPYEPQDDEDYFDIHTVDDSFDRMTDVVPPKITPKIQPPLSSRQQTKTPTNVPITAAKPMIQKCVQFEDKVLPQVERHQQITQWVNNTRTNPPPPPPGYHTSSDGSGPALFSFPSSPVITPATTPNFDDDFDSQSVQLNVPKGANAAMEDARRLISDSNSWNRRESVNLNGVVWGGAPRGMCFKYWNSGSCSHQKNCKFHHVRNPAVDKWWTSDGFLSEMELLINHSVETAWLYLKPRPPASIPPSLLEAVIMSYTNRPLLSINHSTFIQIAEDAFSRLLSLQRCPRDYFFTMLKCYAAHHCNTQAFWLVQEMNKYGYLLSKDMAICLLGCYQPPVTRLLDLLSWIESAGLFQSMYNRIVQCVTMETPLQELCTLLETCARHRVKLHHGNTTSLLNICMAQNNCEAAIRALEVSHDPTVVSPQHLEQLLMTHAPEYLDRVANIVVTLFPYDVCQQVSRTAWNKLLSQCCAQQRSAKAMQIFNYMSRISMKIDKEVYVSLMMLHCNQRHPSEVLTVLEHQMRCHGDTSSIVMICQELLKHHYWDVVCDLVICVINTGNKVEEWMIQDVKNALLQNNEVQRWKSLVEKAGSIGMELDRPVAIPTLLEPPEPVLFPSHPVTTAAPQQEQQQWLEHQKHQDAVKQGQPNQSLSFFLDSVDSSIAPPQIVTPSPAVAPPPAAAVPPVAAPPTTVTPAASQQQLTVSSASLPIQGDVLDFSFLLPNETMQEHNIAPPPALQPQLSNLAVPSVEEDKGVFGIVKKSIVEGHWVSLGAIVQLLPISLQLVQVVATALQSHSNIPNAITSMITSFKKFRQIENNGQLMGEELTPHERDLIGRVGVSMIMNAVAMEKWQNGFHVLYALHHHGIHYVSDQGGWSPCIIAMAAVECCLHLDIPQSALEVMRGAQWVSGNDLVERNKRNTVLEKLLRACVAKKEIAGAEETLQAMESTLPSANHGELFQLVLTTAKQHGDNVIYNRLCKKNQLPSVANTTVTTFSVEASNNCSTINLFSADKTIHFGAQTATSPAITAVLPSTALTVATEMQPPAEAKRGMKTEFRQKVTKACSQQLKHFIKENRINKDDYVHLVRVLSKKFYHQVEAASSGPWELTDLLSQEIHQTVENLFSQCTVYTKDLDAKLNLVDES